MKVTDVTTTLYRYRWTQRMQDAGASAGQTMATGCLVELATDAGLVGIGVGGERSRAAVERLATNLLLGQDPRLVTGLWQRMAARCCSRGSEGLISEALAVIDVALWDLKAKANDEPLWKTLGAARPRANVYLSDGGLPHTDDALFRWYRGMAADYGFREGKLTVGLNQESDMRRLGLVRDALGARRAAPVLMLDADECWAPEQAVRKVREIQTEYDLTWVEAPALRWDFRGFKRVSNSVRAAVCGGGYLHSHADFMPHWHHHSLDVVQLDPARTGITVALQLADTAYGYELPVTLTASPGNINAHLAGAMPYFMGLEVVDPSPSDDVLSTDVRIVDGWAVAGDRPGNGLAIDYGALAAARVDAPLGE